VQFCTDACERTAVNFLAVCGESCELKAAGTETGDHGLFALTDHQEKETNEMGNRGLQEALLATDGFGASTRSWHFQASHIKLVPALRVLSVETVMDVERAILWPDAGGEQPIENDNVAAAGAQEYALLAMLLARTPDAATLSRIANLRGDATPLGLARAALAQAADNASTERTERIEREFFNLLIGIDRGELLPYGSYYLTSFLNERPLARLREDLHVLGMERAEGEAEPEDHAAIRCEIMAGLADGQFAATDGGQQQFFEKHLAPWIGRFFADLERAEAANFYRRAGTAGRLFLEIETEAFALPA
jgi:TorA maturation chaperone TorD